VQFISILPRYLEDVTDNGELAAKRSGGEDGQGFRRAEPAGGKRSMDATDGQSVGPGRSALQMWPPRGAAQKAETGGNILSGPFGDIVLGLNSVSTTSIETFYYSSQWQVIQDDSQVSPSATPQIADQYVWGEANVNELVLRDRHSGEGLGYNYGIANSGLDERIYALQDANWNVTSLINFTGNYVLERFTYDPYGNVTVRNCGEEPITDQYNWVYLFQGGRVDLATGLYTFQHRNYSPSLGTWVEQDPLGCFDSMNLYQAEMSNPVRFVDPSGESIQIIWGNGNPPQEIPPTSEGLGDILRNAPPGSIQGIVITGHGADGVVWLGDSNGWFSGWRPGAWLPGDENGIMNDKTDFLQMGNPNKEGKAPIVDGKGNDLTGPLKKALAPNATVELNACDTDQLAKQMSVALPNHAVTGISGTALRTGWNSAIGSKNTYINGSPPPPPSRPPFSTLGPINPICGF